MKTTITWDAIQIASTTISIGAIVFLIVHRHLMTKHGVPQLVLALIGIITMGLGMYLIIQLPAPDYEWMRWISVGVGILLVALVPIVCHFTQKQVLKKLFDEGETYLTTNNVPRLTNRAVSVKPIESSASGNKTSPEESDDLKNSMRIEGEHDKREEALVA
ncbi:MAG: hypothetical protein KBC98_02420 [Candidatus Pacebacteria bacterium]|nr:hypothetical protein [Candidatus Paceibacterota bacterium]